MILIKVKPFFCSINLFHFNNNNNNNNNNKIIYIVKYRSERQDYRDDEQKYDDEQPYMDDFGRDMTRKKSLSSQLTPEKETEDREKQPSPHISEYERRDGEFISQEDTEFNNLNDEREGDGENIIDFEDDSALMDDEELHDRPKTPPSPDNKYQSSSLGRRRHSSSSRKHKSTKYSKTYRNESPPDRKDYERAYHSKHHRPSSSRRDGRDDRDDRDEHYHRRSSHKEKRHYSSSSSGRHSHRDRYHRYRD